MVADPSDIWTPDDYQLGDLATMDYEDLVAALQKDLQLNAATDLAPGSLQTALKVSWTNAGITYFTGAGTGNWQDYDTAPNGWPGLQYAIDASGFCHLRGTVKNGTAVVYPSTNLQIATLPAALTPAKIARVNFAYIDNAGHDGIPYGYVLGGLHVLQLGGIDFAENTANSGTYLPLWVEGMWIPGQ